MFKRILAPMDRSSLAECVLPHTVAIARAFESHVTLVHVMDSSSSATWHRALDPLNWQIKKAEAEFYLRELTLRLQELGVRTDKHILEGQAAEQVVEFSGAHNIQLVIVSSHGQSGLSGWNVSSVVQKIILRVHTSLLIVRAYRPTSTEATGLRYRRVLIPVDGSHRAECVLPVARALAHSQETEILLAHVIQRPAIPRRTRPTREDLELVDRIVGRNRTETIQYLDELQSQLSGKVETRILVSDQAAVALHELADQEKVDLILLSAHGCSALSQWPFGSVVSSFINYGTTPLLIIQDLPPNKIEPTRAEVAAREHGRR
ncbi:MAG: universal stress protein [Acidobacteriia bacterium]|nr:universal stress protein [Terriglobia bacterium]